MHVSLFEHMDYVTLPASRRASSTPTFNAGASVAQAKTTAHVRDSLRDGRRRCLSQCDLGVTHHETCGCLGKAWVALTPWRAGHRGVGRVVEPPQAPRGVRPGSPGRVRTRLTPDGAAGEPRPARRCGANRRLRPSLRPAGCSPAAGRQPSSSSLRCGGFRLILARLQEQTAFTRDGS